MRKFWILFILIMSISFNVLSAMQLILNNDRIITGKFIKIDKESVIIFSQEKLVTVSISIIATVLDNQKKEIPINVLMNRKKGRINYNSVMGEVIITPSDIDKTSLIFPHNSTFATIYLKDGSKYYGYIEGNDGLTILVYNCEKNTSHLIVHKDIKKILHNSVNVTEDILAYIDGINFSLVESFEIINIQKYGAQINAYNRHINRKNFCITLGCDFGLNHMLKSFKSEYNFNLNPSGYIKIEMIDNGSIQAGSGIGFQFNKEIRHSRGAACSFIPIYLILEKRAEPIGLKGNLGINLFFANYSYKGSADLIHGLFFAAGPTFAVSNAVTVEMMYTLNSGKINAFYVLNHSISIGLTFK